MRAVPAGYFWNLVAVWLTVAVWRWSPLHRGALEEIGHTILLAVAVTYTVLGGVFAVLERDHSPSRAQLGFAALSKWLRGQRPSTEEAVSARFVLVKFCFVPLMMNFAILHLMRVVGAAIAWATAKPIPSEGLRHGGWFELYGYTMAIAVMFLIDTAYFSFGYLVEDKGWNNGVRSVEPTLFGWFIAMMCYPPYSNWSIGVLEWHSIDHASFVSWPATVGLHVVVLLLIAVYTWASVALGPRCSNLTNRGTVRRGPYAVVRHPAYASKVTAWWLMILPAWSAVAAASMAAWTAIYTLRALTEERHLERDPEYREYQARVRWRFVPGLL
jgi:protein-S-isoprenylcysteine O-methyltransferase Ste14